MILACCIYGHAVERCGNYHRVTAQHNHRDLGDIKRSDMRDHRLCIPADSLVLLLLPRRAHPTVRFHSPRSLYLSYFFFFCTSSSFTGCNMILVLLFCPAGVAPEWPFDQSYDSALRSDMAWVYDRGANSLCEDLLIVVERHGNDWCTEHGWAGIRIAIIEVFWRECCDVNLCSSNPTNSP